jgi:hypothetical protein
MKDTPIYINSKDRYSYLKMLITQLERLGTTNIIIMDTGSTYQPMLDYYETLKYPIVRLGNVPTDAQHALWNYNVLGQFGHGSSWFVYTDCDVVPVEDCPADYLDFMFNALQQFPDRVKAGFGLKIDDIPEHYQHKYTKPGKDPRYNPGIMDWETQFWSAPIGTHLYDAPIDTTFALYRPGVRGKSDQRAIRTGGPYIARHMTWYTNSANPSEEELYYKAHVVPGVSSWEL